MGQTFRKLFDTFFGNQEMRVFDQLKKVFDQFDTNGDGKISGVDLGGVYKAMGSSFTETELNRVLEEVDTDRDAYINVDEFSALCRSSSTATEIRDAFDLYYQDKNGLNYHK